MNAPTPQVEFVRAVRRQILANGYEAIPIRGKAPHWNGWADGEVTDARLTEIEALYPDHTNTGIRTGRCVAVDIDLTDEAHATEIESVVTASLGKTPLRRIGSKGALLCYFNADPIAKLSVSGAGKRLVEFLGAGQQFAAYGEHPETGKAYDWPTDFLGDAPAHTRLAELPQVTPGALQATARKVADKLRELEYSNVTVTGSQSSMEPHDASPASGAPVTEEIVEDMLGCIDPGCDRNQWLTVCGGLCNAPVRDPDFDGLELFRRWSKGDLHAGLSPRNFVSEQDCENEWRRDEQKRARGGSVPMFGALVNLARARGYSGLSQFASVDEVFGSALDQLKLRERPSGPVRVSDVLKRNVPPVQELIPGLLEKGTVTFLSAPGGSHKSRIAVQWGLSIEAAFPIYRRAVERAHFVYLSYEDHPDEVARRMQAIAQRLQLPTDSDAEYWDLCGRDAPLAIVSEDGVCKTTPHWDRLCAHVRAVSGHTFLVIDSTYNALRFVGAAKINEGAVMSAIGLLQRLCDECDCTLLILWHPSQAGQERGDASGWSVAWHNAPRARLSLTPVKDIEDAFELKVEKRNHGPKGKPITLHWNGGTLDPLTSVAESALTQALDEAVVRVATMAAETGSPIQKQRRLLKWQLDEIEKQVGRRPSDRETKEALASTLPRGRLRYVSGSQHRTAGYYPPDQERALELSHAAKHAATTRGDDA